MANFFGDLAASLRDSAERDWRTLARPSQLPPPGDWSIWLLLAGRGFGKTRVISEWVLEQVQAGARRIALVAATAADARDVVVEGESGIMACAPKWNRPEYEPSKRRLTWPNGALATLYSADEPERLRGPQHDAAVCDELAAWRYVEAWDMLMLGLRLGKNPRCVVATTPKPTKLIRDLVSREGKDVVITRGRTQENEANLAPQFLKTIVARFQGTRLGRQELDGELLLDTPGALWSATMLEETRVSQAPALQRIVIGVDPSGSANDTAGECGVVCCGLGLDGEGYVLSDLSGRLTPPEWARRAIDTYRVHRADRIVAEVNFGGDMVVATIAAVDPSVPVKAITSSRGKVLRAEPISTFFEQGRAHLVGTFPELEDQLTSFTSDYNRARDGSPDRLDAMVFALTELMCNQPVGGFFRESSLLVNGEALEMPNRVDEVFGVAAANPDTDSLGVIYFGASQLPDQAPPLTILGWELVEAEEVLTRDWLPGVLETLRLYALECARPGHTRAPLFIEETPFGQALLELGAASNLDVLPIPNETLARNLPDRATAARNYTSAGSVRVCRRAHQHIATHRGVSRNHLMAQLLGFDPNVKQRELELVDALCIGIISGLQGRGASALPLFDTSAVAVQGAASTLPAPADDDSPKPWNQPGAYRVF
jgi:predicted phage terminase large subunit-like protein